MHRLDAGNEAMKPGDNLLAAGMTMPVASSQIGAQSFAWSRLAYAGGTHLVSGDALFTRFQPIWDPALTWARHFVLRSTVSFQPTTKGVPANTVVSAVTEGNAAPQPLLTAGVYLLDGTALAIAQQSEALMTPVATLVSRADAGMKYALGSGFSFSGKAVQADGFLLGQNYLLGNGLVPVEGTVLGDGFLLGNGFMLNEGFLLREGFMLNEGFLLREGFLLNEGFLLRETLGGDAAGSNDLSFRGD